MNASTGSLQKPLPIMDAAQLKEDLRKALERIPPFSECCAAGYPEGSDVGDHMMWLGMMLWIRNERKARVRYVAGRNHFNGRSFRTFSGSGPILFNEGILGDCREERLQFCERIIESCHHRPIFILPHTLRFYNTKRLAQARHVFNSHPNLTLFLRDKTSLIVAQEHFGDCEIHQASDMSLELADHLSRVKGLKPRRPLLIHRRDDERLKEFDPLALEVGPAAVYEDWKPLLRQNSAKRLMELCTAQGWKPLLLGLRSRSYAGLPWACRLLAGLSKELPWKAMHFRSLEILISGIHQMMTYRYVITNRLHGHLLCLMLGKAHLLLADELTRNEEFFRLWTASGSGASSRQIC